MSSRTGLTTLIVAGITVVLAAAIALTTVALSRPKEASRPDPVAATVPVALQAEGLPKDFSIGVVLTLGQSGEPGGHEGDRRGPPGGRGCGGDAQPDQHWDAQHLLQ